MSRIFNIDNIPEEMLPSVGGKARGLYKLIKQGFDVPPAFIVTEISENEDFSNVLEEYNRYGGLVSVRSSATLEDGDDFSAAGQFSTFLNVEGEEALLEAVRGCADSINNETALKYSKTFLQGAAGKMTVIVQRMVSPRCAGVIFTHAPMRAGYSLVEAVPGLGENLVSGKVSAQQYRVKGEAIEEMPASPILSRNEAVTLAAEGLKAESNFGMPLDLEWAIDHNGKIWWLQARPITVTESVTANELDCTLDARKFVYTTGNIGEVMPGAVTPLNLSTAMYALDWGVRETYINIGCTGEDIPPYSYIASYYNHMFFNMTSMYAVSRSVLGTSKETMDVSICGQVLEGMPDTDMKNRPLPVKLKNMVPFLKLVFSGEAARKGMDSSIASIQFNLSDDIRGIYRQILDNFEAFKWVHYYHYCASYYSGGQSNMLIATALGAFGDRRELEPLVAGCLTQIEEFESASILRYMTSLAEEILKVKPDASQMSVSELAEYMKTAPSSVQESRDAFMKRHGHRGIREVEIMSLPWRDNPDSFFTSLKSVISSCAGSGQRDEKPWTEYADAILSRFKGSKRRTISGMIDRARKGVCYREYTKSMVVLAIDRFRQAYRRLAKLMVEEGMLPDEECIFFLQQDEVGRLIEGDRSLVKKAVARRRLFPMQMDLKFPYCQVGTPVPLSVAETSGDALVLKGTPVSRGLASGTARVVRNEEDASKLEKGDIMIVESTDIGWSPYYSIVSGLVTEIGSALSHGVVVAREYALPTVVNVGNAMHLIRTGDKISIDGNTGSVIITERK